MTIAADVRIGAPSVAPSSFMSPSRWLALMALSAFVVDYGVLWAARGRPRTPPTPAALAAAISLAFVASTTGAWRRAERVAAARANPVWGASAGHHYG